MRGCSAVVALITASILQDSRILTQEEAKERAWWLSLKVPNIQSEGKWLKRKVGDETDKESEVEVRKKLIFDNDSIGLCDILDVMHIDVNANKRFYIGISASLVATQLSLGNLCISCVCSECESCTLRSFGLMVDSDACAIGVQPVENMPEQPVVNPKHVSSSPAKPSHSPAKPSHSCLYISILKHIVLLLFYGNSRPNFDKNLPK